MPTSKVPQSTKKKEKLGGGGETGSWKNLKKWCHFFLGGGRFVENFRKVSAALEPDILIHTPFLALSKAQVLGGGLCM